MTLQKISLSTPFALLALTVTTVWIGCAEGPRQGTLAPKSVVTAQPTQQSSNAVVQAQPTPDVSPTPATVAASPLKPPEGNLPPVIAAIGKQLVGWGKTVQIKVQITEPNNDDMKVEFRTTGDKIPPQSLDPLNPVIILSADEAARSEIIPAVVVATDKWGVKSVPILFDIEIVGKSLINQGANAACETIQDANQRLLCQTAGGLIR